MKKTKIVLLFLVFIVTTAVVARIFTTKDIKSDDNNNLTNNVDLIEESKPLDNQLEDEEGEKVTEIVEESIEVIEEVDIIEEMVSSMTLEEKVGQMFIVPPEVFSSSSPVTTYNQLDTDKIKKYNVGGFIFFGGNVVNPTQLTDLTTNIKNINEKYNFLISIDEEGGQVARISNNMNFPDKRIENMQDIGQKKDFNRAYEVGSTIGEYLNKYGFNLNYAPVCDVLLNNENNVVKKRSFGSDGDVVANMSLNVMNGLKEKEIISCAKHFPGHGNTALDTHYGFATSNASLEEMEKGELVPFKLLIENGIDMVMISHVIYPKLSNDETPATLNKDIVTSLLKEDLGFNGVIITDGMNMGAIANNYTVEDSTKKAINAGVDIILMPSDFYVAYNGVIEGVNSGEISEERINESVYKILTLKNTHLNKVN